MYREISISIARFHASGSPEHGRKSERVATTTAKALDFGGLDSSSVLFIINHRPPKGGFKKGDPKIKLPLSDVKVTIK